MSRWPWRWLGMVAVLAAFASILFIPDPTAHDLSLLSNRQLVDMLGSPRAVVRDAAGGQLLARSKSIVPELATAVLNADDVRRDAIIALLQELFLSNDAMVCEAAESTLEELARNSDSSLAKAAEQVLLANSNLRHVRALTRLIQLGATSREFEMASPAETGPREITAEHPWSLHAHIVVFDSRWQGGDEGLKYLARIYPFDSLALHITHDAPISPEALQHLRTRRQRVGVRRENESCLGVLVEESRPIPGGGVRFSQVVANSPAAYAGLRRADILIAFNGRTIHSFSDLQECAASCHPGDRVELRIIREADSYRVKLPLGSDFRTGVCSCLASK